MPRISDPTGQRVSRMSEEWEGWLEWENSRVSPGSEMGSSSSPTSVDDHRQLPSPETSVASDEYTNKRKASDESSDSSRQAKRVVQEETLAQNKAHSLIEKRYRTNLNKKIIDLGSHIPALRGHENESMGDQGVSLLKHNKATVLTEAIAHIKHLENRNAQLERINKEQSAQLRHARHAEPEYIPVPPVVKIEATSNSFLDELTDNASDQHINCDASASSSSPTVEGMIKVPEMWRKMWRGELQAYKSESSKTNTSDGVGRSRGERVTATGRKYAGRLLAGSAVAGLTVVDGLAAAKQDRPDDRGLYALPLIRHLSSSPDQFIRLNIPLLNFDVSPTRNPHFLYMLIKGFLIFGVLGSFLFVYLFYSRPPSKKVTTATPTAHKTSDLTPLAVRQRAFLTSIQTVWVPRHHVLPELLALNLETAAYVIRQILGWQMCSWLTGRSEDEEIARIRAWDIAIDAQLSGGDPEISKSRLVLTLWAAGTLPSSPTRLMLKALHIRILFWQASRIPWISVLMHDAAKRLARWQWNKAREMQKLTADTSFDQPESLPKHLETLLSLDSDEVLSDSIIQRAQYFVWNASSSMSKHTNFVMEDSAMRGPLDAVAISLGGSCLNETLASYLSSDCVANKADVCKALETYTDIAPQGSAIESTTLAAIAVIRSDKEDSAIQRLIRILSPVPLDDNAVTIVLNTPYEVDFTQMAYKPNPDVLFSVKCAMACIALRLPNTDSEKVVRVVLGLLTDDHADNRIGLLGLLALRMLYSAICEIDRPVCSNSVVCRATEIKQMLIAACAFADSTLDADIRQSLADIFSNLHPEKLKRRRESNTSHDTGYDSMSDDCG